MEKIKIYRDSDRLIEKSGREREREVDKEREIERGREKERDRDGRSKNEEMSGKKTHDKTSRCLQRHANRRPTPPSS